MKFRPLATFKGTTNQNLTENDDDDDDDDDDNVDDDDDNYERFLFFFYSHARIWGKRGRIIPCLRSFFISFLSRDQLARINFTLTPGSVYSGSAS